jgi:cytochrome c-type biogenesis protein
VTEAAFLGTLSFAVGAGLTTFLAPCAFPLLPGYVGYYLNERDGDDRLGGLVPGLAAAAGALVTLGAVWAVGLTFGQALLSRVVVFEPLVGLALVILGGLVLFDRAPELTVPLPDRPGSLAQFGLFGAAYALAAAGCIVPFVLGVVAQAATLPTGQALAVFGAYAGSVALPLVGVTLLAGAGVGAWRSLGRYTGRVRQVAAGLMIVAGVGQLYLSLVVLEAL